MDSDLLYFILSNGEVNLNSDMGLAYSYRKTVKDMSTAYIDPRIAGESVIMIKREVRIVDCFFCRLQVYLCTGIIG